MYHVEEPDSLQGPSGGGCMTYSISKVSRIPNPSPPAPVASVAKRFLDFLHHYVVYHAMLRMLKKSIAKGSAILHPHSFHLYGVQYSPPSEHHHDESGFKRKKERKEIQRLRYLGKGPSTPRWIVVHGTVNYEDCEGGGVNRYSTFGMQTLLLFHASCLCGFYLEPFGVRDVLDDNKKTGKNTSFIQDRLGEFQMRSLF